MDKIIIHKIILEGGVDPLPLWTQYVVEIFRQLANHLVHV